MCGFLYETKNVHLLSIYWTPTLSQAQWGARNIFWSQNRQFLPTPMYLEKQWRQWLKSYTAKYIILPWRRDATGLWSVVTGWTGSHTGNNRNKRCWSWDFKIELEWSVGEGSRKKHCIDDDSKSQGRPADLRTWGSASHGDAESEGQVFGCHRSGRWRPHKVQAWELCVEGWEIGGSWWCEFYLI